MRVVVTDESGAVLHKYTIKNFVGRVDAHVRYVLEPDHEGGRDEGGVVEAEDLFGEMVPDLNGHPAFRGGEVAFGTAGAAAAGGGGAGGRCEGVPRTVVVEERPVTRSGIGGGGFVHGEKNAEKGSHRPRDRIRSITSSAFF
jgi:hypothetical protein